jgi:hypothetical protein
MSFRERAAQQAQQDAEAQRVANAAEREKVIARLTTKLSEMYGFPAVYVGVVEMAKTKHVNTGWGRGSTEVLDVHRGHHFRLDDVDIVAWKAVTSSSYDFYLLHHDPNETPAHYFGIHSLYVFGQLTTDEEKQAALVKELAKPMHRNTKHPAVRLREKAETCPTCGRGF